MRAAFADCESGSKLMQRQERQALFHNVELFHRQPMLFVLADGIGVHQSHLGDLWGSLLLGGAIAAVAVVLGILNIRRIVVAVENTVVVIFKVDFQKVVRTCHRWETHDKMALFLL